MLRPIDPEQVVREMQRMLELNETRETPYLQAYFQRIQRDGWVTRNSRIYHLYEIFDHLKGYCCVIPLTRCAYGDFRIARRFPWRDLVAGDILPEADYLRALEKGEALALWVESFTYGDEHAYHVVGHYLLDHLRHLNLYGLVAESSCPQSEENCRFLGLQEIESYDKCPTGTRRLWRADETLVANPEWPFGPPFQSLALEEAERRVAQLYYGPWNKQGPLTEAQVARRLKRSVNTVKTQLASIRAKADQVIGTRDRDRIALWLHLHPSELVLPEKK